MEVGFRLFSAPDFDSFCSPARATDVTQLRSSSPRIRLRVGDRFPLGSLKIVALDAAGAVLPKVPVEIEVDERPDVFELRSDKIADSLLTAKSPGQVRLRIRTICNGSKAETFVPADVRQ
jgi:hypothetical protein